MPSRPITLQRIDHVVLRVRDLDASLRFYRDVLGCELEKTQEQLGLYQLRAGDSLIDLVTLNGPLGQEYPAAPDGQAPNMDHVCVQVEPWDEQLILSFLAQQQLDPGEVTQRYGARGYGPSIYIRDPDGNTVELKGPPSQGGIC